MSTFKVAVGPMSKETVEAVFELSEEKKRSLALIASKNQIDYDSGYVEGWSTYRFMEFVKAMRVVYPGADVTVCRDHCGPGFNGVYDPIDVMETIQADVQCGFDLIHIDFCKEKGTRNEQIETAIAAIKYAKTVADDVGADLKFEIGTDEIDAGLSSLDQIEDDIKAFKTVCDPEFFVINTGSHTMENRQVGTFNEDFVRDASALVRSYGIKVKEHNADFLTTEQINRRRGLVDAVNIAPQLGVWQTRLVIDLCAQLGIPHHDWMNNVHKSNKWAKWVLPGNENDLMLCVEASGHYNFMDPAYTKLRSALLREGQGKSKFVQFLKTQIDPYLEGMEANGQLD